jgi:hypothetical protein
MIALILASSKASEMIQSLNLSEIKFSFILSINSIGLSPDFRVVFAR